MDYEMLKSYTDEERKKAKNIITYKIGNNTKKKICFVINNNQMDFNGCNSIDFLKKKEFDSISPRWTTFILDNTKFPNQNNILEILSVQNEKVSSDSLDVFSEKYRQIENNMNSVYYKNIGDFDSLESLIFLNPGEYKIFKKTLFLPIHLEKDQNFVLNFAALVINPKYKYDFSLAIASNREFLKGTLPEYKLKEIKDNGYEIFDGKLLSNKVPLILKK